MHRYFIELILVALAIGFGGVALIADIIALSTDYWMYVSEELAVHNFDIENEDQVENDSFYFENITDSNMNIKVYTAFGLWRFCVLSEDENLCTTLDYTFTSKVNESSIKVALSQCEATPFFVTSMVLVSVCMVCNVLGHIKWDILRITAPFYYLVTALFIAVGIGVYTANTQSVITSTTTTSDCQTCIEYAYGWSFGFMVTSLIGCLVSSVVCGILYYRKRTINIQTRGGKILMATIEENNYTTEN